MLQEELVTTQGFYKVRVNDFHRRLDYLYTTFSTKIGVKSKPIKNSYIRTLFACLQFPTLFYAFAACIFFKF